MMPPATSDTRPRVSWESPRGHGGVAVGRLIGSDREQFDALLAALSSSAAPPVGSIVHRSLAGIDDGVIARVDAHSAWIMPHGGDRIVAAIDAWLRPRCAPCDTALPVRAAFPEATSDCEALALDAIARGASPRAIALLLSQPALWANPPGPPHPPARTRELARLLSPARVVAVGAANVGKSSLLNALAGRTVAIAMDFAGTTRDAVAARIELDGIDVDWFDTPGIRETDDPIELAAQRMAAMIVDGADLVVEVCAPGMPLAPLSSSSRRLIVSTQADRDPLRQSRESREAAVCVSATERTGLGDLARTVRQALVSDEALRDPSPWLFHERLATAP